MDTRVARRQRGGPARDGGRVTGGCLTPAERAAAGLGPAVPPLVTGIVDVHNGDGACDLAAFRAGGGVAFIHKATEGGDFTDKAFARVVPTLRAEGLLIGLYHFANAGDPARQAEHFLRKVEPHPDALLILDCETAPKGSKFGTMNAAQAAVFVTRVRVASGRWPVFYTYESLLFSMMAKAAPADRATLGKCPLWIAKYGPPPKAMPASWGAWGDWSMWQYTSSVENGPADKVRYPRGVPGFKRRSQDRSCFRGTGEELALWWATCGQGP